MSPSSTAGARLRAAWEVESPLQIAGTINAYAAKLAESAGFRALYVSGAGVANASFGLPDLGVTTLNDVTEDVRRVTAATELPVLVDADTGFGSAFNIARTVRELIRAGAAGAHIEDQVAEKRCGHRPNKALVGRAEMVDRIRAAVDAKTDPDFVLMARTDALASEGFDGLMERVVAYEAAGADALFVEAVTDIEIYARVTKVSRLPVLANLTEFGMTPLYTRDELRAAGVRLVLYPLSAFRAMSAAALDVYRAIREEGTQRGMLGRMQTRDELYEVLGYHAFERKLDELFGKS